MAGLSKLSSHSWESSQTENPLGSALLGVWSRGGDGSTYIMRVCFGDGCMVVGECKVPKMLLLRRRFSTADGVFVWEMWWWGMRQLSGLVRRIWMRRNDVIHGGAFPNLDVIMQLTSKAMLEFSLANDKRDVAEAFIPRRDWDSLESFRTGLGEDKLWRSSGQATRSDGAGCGGPWFSRLYIGCEGSGSGWVSYGSNCWGISASLGHLILSWDGIYLKGIPNLL